MLSHKVKNSQLKIRYIHLIRGIRVLLYSVIRCVHTIGQREDHASARLQEHLQGRRWCCHQRQMCVLTLVSYTSLPMLQLQITICPVNGKTMQWRGCGNTGKAVVGVVTNDTCAAGLC